MFHTLKLAVVLAAMVQLGQSQTRADWSEFRGPGRHAVLASGQAPSVWPESFNRAWAVEIGEGYSSPVVAGGLTFIHSRQDPQESVTAIDIATGASRWRESYQAPITKNGYASQMKKGPNATPLVTGGRLFALGAAGHVLALDAATGKRLWSKDFSAMVDTSKLFCGTAASPILVNGSIVIQVGSDVRGGLVVALDPATGTEKWQWKGDGPGYASPVLLTAGGADHLVTLTNRTIVALNPRTGALSWSVPFADEWHENIVTPVVSGGSIVVSGIRQGTRAFTITPTSGGFEATERWKNPDVTMYMSSPVTGDGLIYGLSAKRKGQFVALDAATGATRWASEGREGEQAAVLLAPRQVLFLTNTGALVVVRRTGAAFEVEKRYDISDNETWSTPVFLGGSILVRDATHLVRLDPK